MSMPAWEQTAEGQNVESAWGYLVTTYQNDVPSIIDQLATLTNNPL